MLTNRPDGLGKLEHAATVGVVLLAVGSFVLSYDALHQLAVANGVPQPLAWVWPLIIDGFIITASVAALQSILAGRRAAYPSLLLLVFSASSVGFNVLHAPPTLVARLVAAIPPLTLLLSFDLLMRQLRHRLSLATAICDDESTAAADVEDQPGPQTHRTDIIGSSVRPNALGLLDQARAHYQEHTNLGIKLTGKMLAQLLGISDGYARRLLRQIASAVTEPTG